MGLWSLMKNTGYGWGDQIGLLVVIFLLRAAKWHSPSRALRAYQMLSAVVDKVGDSELGRRAAQKALDCLVRINTERFGRKAEIAAATRRLAN